MADIRTIKIFLASSEELADERIRFGDFIRTLDDTYEQRGFRIKLIKWEDLPKGNDGRPTQETYNEHVRQCDLFVSLFYTKAGEFTLDEYNVANQTQCELGKPTIYVFLRVLDKGEKEDKTLTDFKQNVLGTVKHYWTNYESSDSLQLKFVMDLLKVENKRLEDFKVENGIVNWVNIPVARMDNLSFASGNKDYQRMSQRLQELPEEIADARQLSDDHPEVGRYRDKLQKLLDEQNALKQELAVQQTLLLDTAIRIAQAQGDEITDSMRRATEAFEAGDVTKANEILDQAERQGDRMYEEYLNNKSLQQWRQSLHKTIDELLQQTSMVMADVTVPIEQRIQKAHDLYRKADERAANTLYDKAKYAKLLFDYADFLYKYGKYKESEKIYQRQIAHSEELYSNENADTATSYNNIGLVYNSQGDGHGDMRESPRQGAPRHRHVIQQYRRGVRQPWRLHQGVGILFQGVGDKGESPRQRAPRHRHDVQQYRLCVRQPRRLRQGVGVPFQGGGDKEESPRQGAPRHRHVIQQYRQCVLQPRRL